MSGAASWMEAIGSLATGAGEIAHHTLEHTMPSVARSIPGISTVFNAGAATRRLYLANRATTEGERAEHEAAAALSALEMVPGAGAWLGLGRGGHDLHALATHGPELHQRVAPALLAGRDPNAPLEQRDRFESAMHAAIPMLGLLRDVTDPRKTGDAAVAANGGAPQHH